MHDLSKFAYDSQQEVKQTSVRGLVIGSFSNDDGNARQRQRQRQRERRC